jgi:UDP-N-acetylglucosamine 1-carboxyvinyltransferase
MKIIERKNEIELKCVDRLIKATDISTAVYPGFPTDMQPIFMSVMTTAIGRSVIKETIFDGRFSHVNDLIRMGAIINIAGDVAIIDGVRNLKAAKLQAKDIRSGVALTIAALAAEGVSEVTNVRQVDRGYMRFDETLSNIGANIKRVSSI